ncbi:hypothetical protein LSAT2_007513 [Lamellibrachia satsuma]|nr:hypothetical protein LSAT2_007513 [Lamellibrachia satsuma]
MATHVNGDNNVLFLGDSHVVRFEQYISAPNRSWPGSPFEFGVSICTRKPHYMGITDTTVCSLSSTTRLQEIAYLHPDIVVLHLTGNELDTVSGPTPQSVGMQMYSLAKKLLAVGVKQVVICQMVTQDSWRQLSPEEGEARVSRINEFLQAACSGCTQICYWCHSGFWKTHTSVTLFEKDGVHFNDWGNYKLFRSYRGALQTAARRILQMG